MHLYYIIYKCLKKSIMLKNPNGYGSVYKLSGKRRRPFIARRTIGWATKPDGTKKQAYETIGYFETRKDAILALNNYWNGGVIEAPRLTLENIYNEWSKIHFKHISQSTISQYSAAYKHLQPYHNTKFIDLRTAHFQSVVDVVSTTHKKATLEKIKLLLNLLYDYAIQNDICTKNYAEYLTLPKSDKSIKRTFTDIEIKKLWNNIDMPYVDTILILIYTGLRVSEMLKLTVFDINLEDNTITGGVKTDAGKNRIIPIHQKIQPLIQHYVNTSTNGKLFTINYQKYKKNFIKALDELNIKDLTPHSCRHTFASLMVSAGVEPTALKNIIGHSNYSTTANIYTHFDCETLKNEMNKLK